MKITNKALEEIYEQLDEEMSIVLAPATMNKNVQATMLKNIVLDLEWFDGD